MIILHVNIHYKVIHHGFRVTVVGDKDDTLPVPAMAPESILNCLYNEKTEVYSLSLACYEIWCHGVHAYGGFSKLSTYELVRQVNITDFFFERYW